MECSTRVSGDLDYFCFPKSPSVRRVKQFPPLFFVLFCILLFPPLRRDKLLLGSRWVNWYMLLNSDNDSCLFGSWHHLESGLTGQT